MVPAVRALTMMTLWCLIGAAGGIAAAVGLPVLAGWRAHSVLSGSMSPSVQAGDLAMMRPIEPDVARGGDIVSFPDPNRDGRLLMHRVRRVSRDGDVVRFVTKGDANDTVERWEVPARDRLGVLVYRIPWAGFLAVRVASPLGATTLVAIPALLLAVVQIVAIWRRPGPPAPATARGSAGYRAGTATVPRMRQLPSIYATSHRPSADRRTRR